jgi:hypothetical protein
MFKSLKSEVKILSFNLRVLGDITQTYIKVRSLTIEEKKGWWVVETG